jgi:hypothetical protein
MIVWGTIACCHAAAKNYAQLMVLRVLLGFFESGFFVRLIFCPWSLLFSVGDKLTFSGFSVSPYLFYVTFRLQSLVRFVKNRVKKGRISNAPCDVSRLIVLTLTNSAATNRCGLLFNAVLQEA